MCDVASEVRQPRPSAIIIYIRAHVSHILARLKKQQHSFSRGRALLLELRRHRIAFYKTFISTSNIVLESDLAFNASCSDDVIHPYNGSGDETQGEFTT